MLVEVSTKSLLKGFTKKIGSIVFLGLLSHFASAEEGSGARKFAQLDQMLPTPNVYRTASGAPGAQYWQQKVNYTIDVRLDEEKRRIFASEKIEYINHSPDTLRYLWIQLDQNRFSETSLDQYSRSVSEDKVTYRTLRRSQSFDDNSHGYLITRVADGSKNLHYKIVDTMMRVDLPKPLKPGAKTSLEIDWEFNIIEQVATGGRGGYEKFPDNDTYIFFLAQWFPRLAAYTDYAGWQHKQFLGSGEFTLEFGDYDVKITVPADHVMSSTGALQNPKEMLTSLQRQRLETINATSPIFIITPEEALANETLAKQRGNSGKSKTWHYKAENVRDFAWSSSRKFIWDAMLHEQPGAEYEQVLAMSYYPNEAEPVWSRYSTQAVAHTLAVYSKFSFDYPYPTALSVNTWKSGGMEYPMITFNGYRPTDPDDVHDDCEDDCDEEDEKTDTEEETEKEPTYSRRIKYGLIGVVIHEVGHTYFPMIVNSDERQWTWMDEGLNSFLEYLAEQAWEEKFPAYGDHVNILDYIPTYMKSKNQVPIMTQSDSILQFGPNAYSKPTAAFTVLRETVMGRELFDFAFKQYAERWMFKRPTPADFFRTLEDASGVDLDWFWRGWFYTTDHVDLAISDIREYKLLSKDPDKDEAFLRDQWQKEHPEFIADKRNREEKIALRTESYPGITDLYNEMDRFTTTNKERNKYHKYIKNLEDWEKEVLARALSDDRFIYFVDFENIGGLVSPLPLHITYSDGTEKEMMIPAEIWRKNAEKVSRMFIESKPIVSIEIDRNHQIADADHRNNQYPPKIYSSRMEIYKKDKKRRDLMADLLVKLKKEKAKEKQVPLEQK